MSFAQVTMLPMLSHESAIFVATTSIFSGDHYQSSSYRLSVTDKNGNFRFTGLGEWDHKLVIDAPGYQTTTINYSFQTLEDELLVTLQRN